VGAAKRLDDKGKLKKYSETGFGDIRSG